MIFIYFYNYPDDIDSFQNGVDTIINACTTYGSTPISNTPEAIVNSIETIYNNSNSQIDYSYSGGSHFWYRSTDGVLHTHFSIKLDISNFTKVTVASSLLYTLSGISAWVTGTNTYDISTKDTTTITFNIGCDNLKTGPYSIDTSWSINFE